MNLTSRAASLARCAALALSLALLPVRSEADREASPQTETAFGWLVAAALCAVEGMGAGEDLNLNLSLCVWNSDAS